MKQIPILSILTAVLILITASTAGAVSNAAVLYLRVAAGARPAGMGEAFVSIADDATSTYWNPAGLGNAPLAGHMETRMIPANRGEITDVVTMKSYNGKAETWVIVGDQLMMFDGKAWREGRPYNTSSDQTLSAFLKTILNIEDEGELQAMARRVVAANCSVSEQEVDNFVQTIRTHTPDGYAEKEELTRGLDTLKAGYHVCLLNTERFKSLESKLKDAMKDSLLTGEELDKITYSLEQAVMRFLPSQLTVPYAAAIAGHMTCLSSTGSYLWVGTDNGLYRHSGMTWARYTTEQGLPSIDIIDMDEKEEHLLIGTASGMAEYYHGSFNQFPDLPKAPVSAVVLNAPNAGYAVIGNVLYRYDGKMWYDSFSYTVRIDDSIDKIVDRIAIYHTPGEFEYLVRRIRELNSENIPAVTPPASLPEAVMVESDTAAAEMTDGEGEGEAEAEAAVITAPEATDPWLVEGNVIQLPYSPMFRYDVTAIFADVQVWVGTTAGLLSFDGQTWNRHGYKRYVVPGPDSTGEAIAMMAVDIARAQFLVPDSARIATLAANIEEYNELNGRPVMSGQAVYVYYHNIGSTIHTIGKVFGELYVGTEYSLEKLVSDGWESADISGLKPQAFAGTYDFDGQAYYVGNRGLSTETKGRREFVAMFVKWLPTLELDMYYAFLSYVHNVRGLGTFGISAIYLSYGSIEYRDAGGLDLGTGNPYELSLALSYGTSLNSRIKLGGTVKLIDSHLSSIGAGHEQGSGVAYAGAVDLGILVKMTDRIQFGSAITNLGPDISYIDAAQADPLPRNLAMGLSYRLWDTPYNSLVVQGELNKMLTNLNKGIGRELEYAIRHIGAEYWYSDLIAIRAGYKYDKEGQVRHLTFGAGLQYNALRFDLAYVPSSVDSPLANTLRISFSLMY